MGASTIASVEGETNDQSNIEIGHAKEELTYRVGRNEKRRNERKTQINLVII